LDGVMVAIAPRAPAGALKRLKPFGFATHALVVDFAFRSGRPRKLNRPAMDEQPNIEAQLAEIERKSQALDARRSKVNRTIDAALILLTIFVALCMLFTMLF
jgi:hypothetical protein